jgi:leucyl aminopeptidase
MKIDVLIANPLKHTTHALVFGCFEDTKDEMFVKCDAALLGCLGRLIASKEFRGKANSMERS